MRAQAIQCGKCRAPVPAEFFNRKSPARRRSFTGAVQFLQCALGVLAAWFFFYLAGEVLLSIPASFHEGTLWQTGRFESE
jgi:hypothetical protein